MRTKEARRAKLGGRALGVFLAPDGRIEQIVLDERLASLLAEMTEGQAASDLSPDKGAGRSLQEISKGDFSDWARIFAPPGLSDSQAVEALCAFFSGADLTHIYERCVYDKAPSFQRRVMQAMATIPRGNVLSYSGLAKRIGVPQAARAVGNACARNPLPLLFPCHRVVQSDGRIGNFTSQTGGLRPAQRQDVAALRGSQQGGKLKRLLLEYEGVRFDAHGRVLVECFADYAPH